MMKHRAALFSNEISNLAEAMYDDLSFPKQSEDYDEISSYLEPKWNARKYVYI